MHHKGARSEVMLLEEVLRRAVTRKCERVDTNALAVGTERDELGDDLLPHAHFARLLLDEEIGHDTEPRAGAQRFDAHGTEAEHDLVDRADDDAGVVVGKEVAVCLVEWFGPRVTLEPRGTAFHRRQLGAHQTSKLDNARDVVVAGAPAPFHVR